MFKKKDIFFKTLDEMAEVIVEACDRFASIVSNDWSDPVAFAKEMKDIEHKGDKCTLTILTELNKTFITPIEREDIMELVRELDDVLDGIEACTSRFEMYNITTTDEYIRNFGECLRKCGIEIKAAVNLLTQKKLLAMQTHCFKLNELENDGDDLMRKGIKELFQSGKDPIEVIKFKEVYEQLEQTTDSCEDVANTLQSIIMRNS